jgi:hypothetical protein
VWQARDAPPARVGPRVSRRPIFSRAPPSRTARVTALSSSDAAHRGDVHVGSQDSTRSRTEPWRQHSAGRLETRRRAWRPRDVVREGRSHAGWGHEGWRLEAAGGELPPDFGSLRLVCGRARGTLRAAPEPHPGIRPLRPGRTPEPDPGNRFHHEYECSRRRSSLSAVGSDSALLARAGPQRSLTPRNRDSLPTQSCSVPRGA